MKPGFTQDLKERFFALYWGQDVLFYPDEDREWTVNWYKYQANGEFIADAYLLLRPLSAITDNESIEVAKAAYSDFGNYRTSTNGRWLLNQEFQKVVHGISGVDWAQINDYLRSIGVALPFMGHSVESLIEAGWVKLVAEEVPQS